MWCQLNKRIICCATWQMTVSHNRDVALRNATRSWHCYTLVRFEFITRKIWELVYYEIDVLSRNLLHDYLRFGWWKNLLVRNPCQKCEKFYATLSKISEGWMKPGVALSGLRQRQPPLLSFGYKKDPKFSMKPSVQLQNCPEEVFQAWICYLARKEVIDL